MYSRTVAMKVTGSDTWLSAPLRSSAVTVILAPPTETPVIVSVEPFTATDAIVLSADLAVISCMSPSSASVTSTVTSTAWSAPFITVWSAMGDTAG